MRWCGLKKGRLLGNNVREVGGAGWGGGDIYAIQLYR